MPETLYEKVVYILGIVLILAVVGIIGITIFSDKGIPDVLQNLSVGALTGLVGMLVQRENAN